MSYRGDAAKNAGLRDTPARGSGRAAATSVGFRTAYAPGTALRRRGQTVGLLQFDGYYGERHCHL